jgi:L-alanine-DL-glutamate epimerase-like enolase superfamily enzyme
VPKRDSVPIQHLEVSAYTIPTDFPEQDGTLDWSETTIVIVLAHAGGQMGLGYTYSDEAAAGLIHRKLAKLVEGQNAFSIGEAWESMLREVRNLGRPGVAASAISAIDCALWDLKAKLLDLPLVTLLGQRRPAVPIYGSGGFTSYSIGQLESQLGAWVAGGISRVKMKIGRDVQADVERVRAIRAVIGPDAELFVDANGAYSRKQALAQAGRFAEHNVSWFEEPVSSDDLEGLRFVRERSPAGMEIAAGEYGYDHWYFRRMLEARAVDVLQADATRCCGFTGMLQAAELCLASHMECSGHTAPALHTHVLCAAPVVRHLEYFHDHVRIENLLFDGVARPVNGELAPDLSRPGIGLEFKRADAERYAA